MVKHWRCPECKIDFIVGKPLGAHDKGHAPQCHCGVGFHHTLIRKGKELVVRMWVDKAPETATFTSEELRQMRRVGRCEVCNIPLFAFSDKIRTRCGDHEGN